MTDNKPEQELLPGALDAAEEVIYWFELYAGSKTPRDQAQALTELENHISDLKSFHPGWDYETGTMPWEREDDDDTL